MTASMLSPMLTELARIILAFMALIEFWGIYAEIKDRMIEKRERYEIEAQARRAARRARIRARRMNR